MQFHEIRWPTYNDHMAKGVSKGSDWEIKTIINNELAIGLYCSLIPSGDIMDLLLLVLPTFCQKNIGEWVNKISEQQYAIHFKHASSYIFENFTHLFQKKKCDLSSYQNAKALILCVLSSWCQEGEFEVDTHMSAQIKSSIKVRLRAQCSRLEQTGISECSSNAYDRVGRNDFNPYWGCKE